MRALTGLKIADFSWVGAGPRSTKDLADNGATVVKVESAQRLDLGRKSPPFAKGARGNPDASAFFAQTNTSKKSVTINLTLPEGQAGVLPVKGGISRHERVEAARHGEIVRTEAFRHQVQRQGAIVGVRGAAHYQVGHGEMIGSIQGGCGGSTPAGTT